MFFMASPSGFVNNTDKLLNLLPPEVASEILLIVQAIGGLVIVYLIFLGVRLYMQRKQLRMIREMNEDIKIIKKRINKLEKR